MTHALALSLWLPVVLFLVKIVGNEIFTTCTCIYFDVPANLNVCNLRSVSDGFAMIAFAVLFIMLMNQSVR